MGYNQVLAITLNKEQPITDAHKWGFESDEEDDNLLMHVPPT